MSEPLEAKYVASPEVSAIFARFFPSQHSDMRLGSDANEYAYVAKMRGVQVHLLLHHMPTMDGETKARARRTLAELGAMLRTEASRQRAQIARMEELMKLLPKSKCNITERQVSLMTDDLADLEGAMLAAAVAQ